MNVKPLQFTVGRANIDDTHLRGHLRVPFSRLVEVFGEPESFPDPKVSFFWRIEFGGQVVATIYDWKISSRWAPGYPTPDQLRASDFDRWNVGGNSRYALSLVREALRPHV